MKKTILVVEDQRNHSLLLKYALEDKGYDDIKTAADIETALKMLQDKKNPPSLVCLDIMLPKSPDDPTIDEEGGFRIAKEIKGVPFIFTSVYERKEEIERGISLGAKAFFVKPFDTEDVAVKTQEIIGK